MKLGSLLLLLALPTACGARSDEKSGGSAVPTSGPSGSATPESTSAPAVSAGDLDIPEGPLTLRMGQSEVVYKTAILHVPSGFSVDGDKKFYDRTATLEISTNEAMSCEKRERGANYISIPLGPGDDGTFYSGREIASTFFVYAEEWKPLLDSNRVYAQAPYLRLKLAEFKPTSEAFDLGLAINQVVNAEKSLTMKGGGHVSVKICANANKEHFDAVMATRVDPPRAEDVAGTVKGGPFASKMGLAFVEKNKDNDVQIVRSINFYATATTCEDASKDFFSGGGYQGVSWSILRAPLTSKNRLTGAAIPVTLSGNDVRTAGGKVSASSLTFANMDSGWMRIDEASLEEGGTIRGVVVVDSGPLPSQRQDQLGRIDGTFTAKVCPVK